MEQILKGKVIVVSGGTKGIGKGIILESARQGANVVIGGRDAAAAEQILKEVQATGQEGLFVHTDLHDAADCAKLFDEAAAKFGKVTGFVNYAGLLPSCDFLDSTPELFDDTFAGNIRAAYFCAQNAIRHMKKGGGGSIVMYGSPHAWCGDKDRSVYACSKGALFTLSEHIAHHYAADQIRCNFVTMGWVPTEGELTLRASQGMSEKELREFASPFMPMGRMQEVADHVPGTIYLLSDYASQVTGSNLRITGGLYIG